MDGYFGWEIDWDTEEDVIKQSEPSEEVVCTESGCVKGYITLLITRIECPICKGTGKVKKEK